LTRSNLFTGLISKISARYQLIDTLFSLVGINIILAGLSFVTTLFIANILGRELFGDLSYAIAVGGYCFTIAYCGLERTLVRDLVHFPKRFDNYISSSILLRCLMVTLAFVGIVGLNAFTAEENRLGIAGMVVVFAVGIKALDLGQVYDAWNKMKQHAVYFLMERCLYFACIWLTILFFRASLSVAVISFFMLGSIAFGFFLQYRWALPRIKIKANTEALALAGEMLKKNLWIWSAVLATLSFGGLSKIVLKHVSGSGELGGYALAWQVVLLGSILITPIGRVGSLRMAKVVQPDVSQARRIRFLLQYTTLSVLVGTVIGLPAICFPTLILKLFRPEYVSAAASMRILGIYVIIVAIGQVGYQYLIAVRKERVCSLCFFLAGFVSIALYYVLIPRYAGMGAALAVLLSHGFGILISLIVVLSDLRYTAQGHTIPRGKKVKK